MKTCASTARPTCPQCGAPVIPIRTPAGQDVLLDPAPLDEIYTLHHHDHETACQMPPEITRRVHRCEAT